MTGCDILTVNKPPVSASQKIFVGIDEQTDITLEAEDPEDDLLTYIITSLPQNGSLFQEDAVLIDTVPFILPDQSDTVTYAPDSGYTGQDSFSFKADDGQLESDEATVSITVGSEEPQDTISEDTTFESLTVTTGETTLITNNAVITVTGDATISGTLKTTDGSLTLKIGGSLTVDGSLSAINSAISDLDNDTSFDEQPAGIYITVSDEEVMFGEDSALETNGFIVITDN